MLGIIAGILVARHLDDDLFDGPPCPRTESLVASAVQWAERIMRRIDGMFASSADDRRGGAALERLTRERQPSSERKFVNSICVR